MEPRPLTEDERAYFLKLIENAHKRWHLIFSRSEDIRKILAAEAYWREQAQRLQRFVQDLASTPQNVRSGQARQLLETLKGQP